MKRLMPVLLVVVVLAGYFSYRHFYRPTVDMSPLRAAGSAVLGKEKTLAEEMDASLDILPTLIAKSPAPACLASWRETLDQKQSAWLDSAEAASQFHVNECLPAEWETLRRFIVKVTGACSGIKKDCRSHLVAYRCKLADGLTVDQRNYSDMSFSLLLSKAYAQTLLDTDEAPRPLSDLLAMVDAIGQRRPGWFPGRKLVIVTLFQREQSEPDDELKAQIASRLDREIEAAQLASTNDPIVREIDRRRQDQGEEPVDMSKPFLPPSILNW